MKISKELFDRLGEYHRLLSEIEDEYQEASESSEIFGCDCGCGGDSRMDCIDSLEEDLVELEEWFSKNDIEIELMEEK